MMRAGPTLDEIRRQNLGALLRQVHVRGALSRAELTSSLGLSRSTIGALSGDLSAAGLVREEQPTAHARAGRPSLVVRPESRFHTWAVAIGVDRVTAARIGLGGDILDRRDAVRAPGDHGPDEVVAPLAAFIREMQQTSPADNVCIGSGAAVSGMTRHADGLVHLSPIGWLDESLTEALTPLGPSVSLGSAAELGALAEHTRGCAVASDNVIYLHGDVGVGGGIIAGGRQVTGHGGHGGEVGHVAVNPSGHRCSCGSRGCWETEIGERALLRAANRSGASYTSVMAVIEAAQRGDVEAQAAVRKVGEWLGFGVANLVNTFNPETVIFGGTLRELFLASAAQVRSRINSMALPACREHVRLRVPDLGNDAPLIGAAELAFQRLLADPIEVATAA